MFLVLLFSVAARASAARSRAALVIALAGVGIATGTAADALRRLTAGGWLITFYLGVGFGLSVLMTWNLGLARPGAPAAGGYRALRSGPARRT